MATTTAAPAIVNDYERALARARKSGIRIMGRGHLRDADRTPFVAVSSAREPNHWHIVAICRTRLACGCYAGLRVTLCQHRALVHAELIRLWRAERDRVEAKVEADLRASLLELDQAHRVLDAAMRRPVPTMPGDAPAITQAEAGRLLQRGISARVYRPDVARLDGAADVSPRLLDDCRPISIWK